MRRRRAVNAEVGFQELAIILIERFAIKGSEDCSARWGVRKVRNPKGGLCQQFLSAACAFGTCANDRDQHCHQHRREQCYHPKLVGKISALGDTPNGDRAHYVEIKRRHELDQGRRIRNLEDCWELPHALSELS